MCVDRPIKRHTRLRCLRRHPDNWSLISEIMNIGNGNCEQPK